MSRTPRFQVIEVQQRGYPVAVIHDSKANRDLKVYCKGGKFLHWDRMDDPVANRTLRSLAREALA